jgi:hypothetical protein
MDRHDVAAALAYGSQVAANLTITYPTDGRTTMSFRKLRMFLCTLAAAAAATFGSAAHAAFYGSDFDPIHFFGSAQFFLTTACETNGVHIQGVGGCTFDLLAGPSVTLVDGTHTSALDFGSNPGKLPDFTDMLFLAYLNGNLAGVTTGFIGGFNAVDQVNFPGLWWLQFVAIPHFSSSSDTLNNLGQHDHSFTLTSVDNSVLLFHDCPTYTIWDHTIARCGNGQLADTAISVRFERVPEPGTLCLILGGLGAGWFARRRKAGV